MRWSPRGAHLMLKVRTSVMNETFNKDHAPSGGPVVLFGERRNYTRVLDGLVTHGALGLHRRLRNITHASREPIAHGSELRLALAISGGDVALDLDYLVHGLDSLVRHLTQHVDVALVAA